MFKILSKNITVNYFYCFLVQLFLSETEDFIEMSLVISDTVDYSRKSNSESPLLAHNTDSLIETGSDSIKDPQDWNQGIRRRTPQIKNEVPRIMNMNAFRTRKLLLSINKLKITPGTKGDQKMFFDWSEHLTTLTQGNES